MGGWVGGWNRRRTGSKDELVDHDLSEGLVGLLGEQGKQLVLFAGADTPPVGQREGGGRGGVGLGVLVFGCWGRWSG